MVLCLRHCFASSIHETGIAGSPSKTGSIVGIRGKQRAAAVPGRLCRDGESSPTEVDARARGAPGASRWHVAGGVIDSRRSALGEYGDDQEMTIQTNPGSRSTVIVATIVLVATLAAVTFAGSPPRPVDPAAARLEAVLSQFDATQATTQTLTASFTERKDLSILKEPIVSKGRFYFTKPDDVLWQYTEPDPRYFLISKDELLAYYPTKKRAQKVSLAFFHDRLLKILAIGQPSAALRKYYEISLEEEANDIADTSLLILSPRKRSVKKRIADVRLWISRGSALPVRMQYTEPDGDTTTITFEDVRFNPEIAASTYQIEIPKDVEIRRGASGLADLKGKG
jgi:outer membrane lipoprotein-sorting protein